MTYLAKARTCSICDNPNGHFTLKREPGFIYCEDCWKSLDEVFIPRCYVYTYTSSLTGKIFYIGKGKGGRYLQHVYEASRKDLTSPNNIQKRSRVAMYVRYVWHQGGKVIIRKVAKHLTNARALELENSLIVQYGTEQLVNRRVLYKSMGETVSVRLNDGNGYIVELPAPKPAYRPL